MPTNLALNENGQPYWEEGADEVRVVVDYDGTPMWTYVGEDLAGKSVLAVDRSVDGGETWEPVTESHVGSVVQDFMGLSHGETLHRGTITTGLGTANHTIVATMTQSWKAWLAAGHEWSETAGLVYNPVLTEGGGRQRASEHYAEEELPTAYAGTAVTRTFGLGGLIDSREEANATAGQLRAIAETPDPLILYRDPLGHRIWGTVTGVSPLEVTLDGQDAALFCSNATGASIPAGRRVFVSIDRGAATVIGRAP